ncbi:beta-propeller fold lactonase family protein [Actinomadura sp. LD22]|uniref:Beta-propeller fold lactonase family protein n=1 Tax=Actinomadura physcomitrii TaxID=2650748 RepID=A0A6I4MD86_9ACTN|nr:YncE family protein [Actinomadura physcomitrii]MWA01761.1 beta-propeller fold lactonase family protein [Actinomadura physcomitrii]
MARGPRRFALTAAGAAAGTALAVLPTAAVARTGPDPGAGPSDEQGVQTGSTAYVALAGSGRVARVDVASHTVTSTAIRADAAEGVAVTPDGRKVYVAATAHYQVIAVDAATLRATPIVVGAHPQDVAVSPDGARAYTAVTGGDTGPGGSSTVAVIDTRTDTVARRIDVGAAPRRVAFAPDGKEAYVTTAGGLTVIDTAKGEVAGKVPGIPDAQGVAVSPDGSRVYATQPDADLLYVVDAARRTVTREVKAGAEPWAVTATPDGRKVYVADMNSDSAGVYDAAGRRHLADVPVGRLPASIAVTPDGSEVWVGNDMTGTVSVIDTSSDEVVTTIRGGSRAETLGASPLDIAFARTP